MCGIAGVYSPFAPDVSKAEMSTFIDTLSHRGPDGKDLFRDLVEPCWLGHRRLNILDLSDAASQPMSYGGGRYWIVFNGEIYNFIELRKELIAKGHVFRTNSDTEVILASYAEWGESCQIKFNGMWAFAIWDSKGKFLFLSRDRFGVKPLYYQFSRGRFLFASELKSFLAMGDDGVEFDHQYIANALRHPAIIESEATTFLKNTLQLPAGHSLIFHAFSGIKLTKWWETLDHIPDVSSRYEDQVEEFSSLFSDACRIRARSDIPIGTALSGGLDSSSVFCKLWELGRDVTVDKVRWAPKWQQVFSASFPNSSQNELGYVKQVLHQCPAKSFEYMVQAKDVIENLSQICYQFEGIFDLPVGPWVLYREYRRNHTYISLDGHGADELFGGYHHQVEYAILESLRNSDGSRFSEMKEIYRYLYPPGSPHAGSPLSSILGRYLSQRFLKRSNWVDYLRKISHLFRGNIRSSVSISDWLKIKPNFDFNYSIDHPNFQRLSFLNQRLYLDFHKLTLPVILRNFDRCSMAHGVEIRAPFLDWRIVCFAFSLPSASKIGGGFTKRIVRKAMEGIIPDSIRLRRDKIGFASPMIEWFREGLKPFILDTLGSDSFLSSPIWNGPSIRNYTEECFRRGDYLNARRCWEFVQTNQLLKSFTRKIPIGI